MVKVGKVTWLRSEGQDQDGLDQMVKVIVVEVTMVKVKEKW